MHKTYKTDSSNIHIKNRAWSPPSLPFHSLPFSPSHFFTSVKSTDGCQNKTVQGVGRAAAGMGGIGGAPIKKWGLSGAPGSEYMPKSKLYFLLDCLKLT